MTNNQQSWKGYKEQNEIIQKLDKRIADIMDKNHGDLEVLHMLLNDLEEKEYLEESESFQKVREHAKEISFNCSNISDIRREKAEYIDKLEQYYKEVERFFDNMINSYAENLDLI